MSNHDPRGIALKWYVSCKHLVEEDAQHINIAGCAHQSLALFGSHIGDRPDHRRLFFKCHIIEQFRQPEIHQHQLPIGPHQQIGGFDITVDYSMFMRIIQRNPNLIQVEANFIRGKRPLLHASSERPPTYIGHHQVRSTLDHSEIVDLENIRMIQGGNSACLAAEAG